MVFLLGGCGGSSSNKPGGGGGAAGAGGVDPGTACTDYVAKYCAKAQACEPGALTLAGLTSLTDCEREYLPFCNDAFTAPHTGETVALRQQCGDGIAALSCTDFLQAGLAVSACRPQGGTIANGGPCNNDWQCASGSCSWLSPDSCGICAQVTSVGQPCQVDATLGAVCPDDLLCAVTPGSPRTPVCAAPVPIGGACAETQVCPRNAYCDLTTKVCTKLPALGQTCDPNAIFDCDPTGPASRCDGVTSVCERVAAATDGQPCADVNGTETRCNGECTLGDAGAGICHTFLARGAACGDNDLCQFDTTCTAGVCTSAVCGGAASSAHAAILTRSRPFDSGRIVRMPQMPLGLTSRPGR